MGAAGGSYEGKRAWGLWLGLNKLRPGVTFMLYEEFKIFYHLSVGCRWVLQRDEGKGIER